MLGVDVRIVDDGISRASALEICQVSETFRGSPSPASTVDAAKVAPGNSRVKDDCPGPHPKEEARLCGNCAATGADEAQRATTGRPAFG